MSGISTSMTHNLRSSVVVAVPVDLFISLWNTCSSIASCEAVFQTPHPNAEHLFAIGLRSWLCRVSDNPKASWYHRAFLRHPDGGEDGCYGEMMYDRALLAFRNLEGLDPAHLSQKEIRENERRGVVGFIPNTVEDSMKKIHAKYKKALEDKVCNKSGQCLYIVGDIMQLLSLLSAEAKLINDAGKL